MTISRVCRCCCNFFRRNPERRPCFFFSECVFPCENQQPSWGHTHFKEANQLFFFQVSSSNNNYSIRFFNHTTTNNTPFPVRASAVHIVFPVLDSLDQVGVALVVHPALNCVILLPKFAMEEVSFIRLLVQRRLGLAVIFTSGCASGSCASSLSSLVVAPSLLLCQCLLVV